MQGYESYIGDPDPEETGFYKWYKRAVCATGALAIIGSAGYAVAKNNQPSAPMTVAADETPDNSAELTAEEATELESSKFMKTIMGAVQEAELEAKSEADETKAKIVKFLEDLLLTSVQKVERSHGIELEILGADCKNTKDIKRLEKLAEAVSFYPESFLRQAIDKIVIAPANLADSCGGEGVLVLISSVDLYSQAHLYFENTVGYDWATKTGANDALWNKPGKHTPNTPTPQELRALTAHQIFNDPAGARSFLAKNFEPEEPYDRSAQAVSNRDTSNTYRLLEMQRYYFNLSGKEMDQSFWEKLGTRRNEDAKKALRGLSEID